MKTTSNYNITLILKVLGMIKIEAVIILNEMMPWDDTMEW
jgi:hypothetical protein